MEDEDSSTAVVSSLEDKFTNRKMTSDDENTLDGDVNFKKPFVCGICNSDFDKIEKYYIHFKEHDVFINTKFHVCIEMVKELHLEHMPRYTCSSCRFKFTSICLLHDHLLGCSKSGSYFYDHQQMAACPEEFCMFSDFTNENEGMSGDMDSSVKDKVFAGECDSQESSVVVATKEEKENGDNDSLSDHFIIEKHINENYDESKQVVSVRIGEKTNVRMPKILDESVTKTMRNMILKNGREKEESNIIQSLESIDSHLARSNRKARNTNLKSTKSSSLLKHNFMNLQKKKEKASKKKEILLKRRSKLTEKRTKITEKTSKITEQRSKIIKKRSKITKKDGDIADKKKRKKKNEKHISVSNFEKSKPTISFKDCTEKVTSTKDYDNCGINDSCEDDMDDSFDDYGSSEDIGESLKDDTEDKALDENGAVKKTSAKTRPGGKTNNVVTSPKKRPDKKPTAEDFKCDICGKIFDTVKECRKHSRSHRSCHICSKTYQHFRALRIHMRSHDDVQPFPCTICGKGFNENRSLQSHMITHTDDKPYKCEVCSAAYKHPHTLKVHERSHSKVMPFCCEVCGDGFVDWCTLKRHKIHKHSDERPFKCPHCGAGFKDNYKLSRHILTHSDVKQHQCEVCGRQLATKSSLAVHMNRHRDREMHECSECGHTFVSKYILKDHQRTHSGEKPFKCPSCPKAHIKRAELRKHMLKHHNVDLDTMDIYPSRKHIIMGKVSTTSSSEDSGVQTRPTDTFQMQPTDEFHTQPTNVIQTLPTDGFHNNPTYMIHSQPTNMIQTQPTSMIQTQPTNVIHTQSANLHISSSSDSNFRSRVDAPMDLSFLSEVEDPTSNLQRAEHSDYTLMPT